MTILGICTEATNRSELCMEIPTIATTISRPEREVSDSSQVLVERKKGVSGGSAGPALDPFGSFRWVVGYEGLTGCDSVDAAYLLNGLFQEFLVAVGSESCQYVERSRYDVCLCKVGDGLQFAQDCIECTSNLQEGEGKWALIV